MELRTTEERMDELVGLYESLRQSSVWSEWGDVLPECPVSLSQAESVMTNTSISDLAAAVQAVNRIQRTLPTLPIDKFRKRLTEQDPITHQPRYGEKTQSRVQTLVDKHDFLQQHVPPCSDSDSVATTTQSILRELQRRHDQNLSQEQQAREDEERERQHQEERAREETLRQRQEQQQQAQEIADQQRREQEAAQFELRRQAEAARQRRLAQERAEQEWITSIRKGPDGVKIQLAAIKESTKEDAEAQQTAIASLYVIFEQINAHPEETKFRRIRRDHEKFTQDIGRHKGGVELLIAAGFELGAIDDVPCYLSKEPNIEDDMDGWSAWFDLLKATLDILEQERSKASKRK